MKNFKLDTFIMGYVILDHLSSTYAYCSLTSAMF